MTRHVTASLSCAVLSLGVLALSACKKKEEPAPAAKPTPEAVKPAEKKEEAAPVAAKPAVPPAEAAPTAAPVSAELAKLGALVPGDSAVVVGVDVQALTQAFFWASLKAELENAPDKKADLDKFKACGYEPEKFKAVVVGIDPHDEQVVVAVSGTGIGKLTQIECLGKTAGEMQKGELEPPKLEKRGGRDVLVLKPKDPAQGDHTMLLLAPTEDQLVFVPEANLAEVEKQISGGAAGVFSAGLKDVIAKTDTSRAVWFAGTISKEAAAGLEMVKLGSAENFSGGLDFRAGMAFGLSFGVDNSASAAAAVDALNVQYTQQKPMLGMFGVPTSVADKVGFAAKDARVNVSLAVGVDEFKQAFDNVKKLLAGQAAAGAGPDATPPASKEPAKGAKRSKKSETPH